MNARSRLLAVAAILALVSACSDALPVRSSPEAPVTTAGPDVDAPVALVVTDDGLAAVRVGSSEPLWVDRDAVAAPDGSAVFAVKPAEAGMVPGRELVAIDLPTGDQRRVVDTVPDRPGFRVAAVEPGGGRVVLAGPGDGDSTLVVVLDPTNREAGLKQAFEGRVEPEALSLDRTLLYASRIYEDRYHVHVLVLADGSQYPTTGPDKSLPPEDMYGDVVQAALSPDGRQLATLYRDDRTASHTAFVHLLALDSGLTVCVDLHAPFGTGVAGSDAIEWRPNGTVAVGHRGDRNVTASFDPASIWNGEPQPHYHAEAVDDPEAPSIPDGIAGVEGFRRFVALVS